MNSSISSGYGGHRKNVSIGLVEETFEKAKGISIDEKTRIRIEKILIDAEPRWKTHTAMVLAHGAAIDFFEGGNGFLQREFGIRLDRGVPVYRNTGDVCSKARPDVLLRFLVGCCQHNRTVASHARSVEPAVLEASLNRVLSEHSVPFQLIEGWLVEDDLLARGEKEQKFAILFASNQAETDFDEMKAGGLPVGLIYLDIDGFKLMNKKYGNDAVDESIVDEAQKLLKRLAEHRGKAYCHGGDEFFVVLRNTGLSEAAEFGERIRGEFEGHVFDIEGEKESVTVSVGIAAYPNHREAFKQVLKAAIHAQISAKEGGGNRIQIAPGPPLMAT